MSTPEPATAGTTTPETEVGSVFVSNYPPFSAWRRDLVPAIHEALDSDPRPDTDLGLYLHIPFCRKRCKFCYFRVYTDKNFDEISAYVDALCREIEIYAEKRAVAGRPLKFVYFGGGTPSYISAKHLRALVERLQAAMPWDAVEEVSFECEPGTLTEAKLEAIKEVGVTRLSLGIENFDDEILRENGRAHVSKEIDRCLPWIEAAGFDQLNIDLIAGMVGESWETWRETVARTVDLMPDSVTVYQMELPFNTRFSGRILDGSFDVPLATWDDKRAWHDFAFDELAKVGYEVSSAYTMVRSKATTRFVYRDSVWAGCDLVGSRGGVVLPHERRALPEHRRMGRVPRDPRREQAAARPRAADVGSRPPDPRADPAAEARPSGRGLLQGQVRRRHRRGVRGRARRARRPRDAAARGGLREADPPRPVAGRQPPADVLRRIVSRRALHLIQLQRRVPNWRVIECQSSIGRGLPVRPPGHSPLGLALAAFLPAVAPASAQDAAEEAEESRATTTIEERLEVEDSAPYIPTSNTIAAKLPIEQAWTPANIGAVGSRLMAEQHAETVGDALENVSGIHSQTGSGVFDFLVIRGFDSLNSGLILIDGAPEPESTFYQLYDAERVEVFKGPAGFLYGSNPLAGVVNIVRKQPVPSDFSTFGIGVGSFGTTDARFDLNASSDEGVASFRLNGHWRESDGFRDGRDQAHAAVHPSFAWRPDARRSLTVNLDRVSSDYRPDAGVPIVDGRPADVPRERSYASPFDDSMQDITRVQVDYEVQLGDRLTLRDKVYYRELDWQTRGTLLSGLLPLGGDALVFRTLLDLDDRQRFFGNQLEMLWRNERHRLLVGVEAQRTTDDFSLGVGLLPTISLLRPAAETTDIPVFPIPGQGSRGDTETSVLAPYVVDQITLSDRVRVLLGARFDTIDFEDRITGTSRSDSELSPMAGLVFAPTPKMSLYANAARSFAPASPRVAGDREPEESRQYELGLRRSFAGGRLDGVLAVYQLERDNIAIPDDNGFTQQAGDQRSRGVEIEFGGQFARGLSGTFSYAFTDAELTRFAELVLLQEPPFFLSLDRSGNTPAFAPESLFNAWLSRSFENGLHVGAGVRWVDSQFIAEDNATELDAYALFDATLSYGAGSWRFSLNLRNLTDEEYETRGFGSFSVIPGEPFATGLRIEYRM